MERKSNDQTMSLNSNCIEIAIQLLVFQIKCFELNIKISKIRSFENMSRISIVLSGISLKNQ